jgi:DNA-binding CsgD family transcriptional regulator/tetratricopeptide (TPR) repeat protein
MKSAMRFLFSMLVLCLASQAMGQIDSIGFYLKDAKKIKHSNPQHALILADRAEQLATNKSNKETVVDVSIVKGEIELGLNHHELAEAHFLKALQVAQEFRLDSKLGACYMALGRFYFVIEKNDISLKYFKLVLEHSKDKHITAQCYNSMGKLAMRAANRTNAVDYYLKSIRLFEEVNDSADIVYALNNLADVMSLQSEHDRGINYAHRALNYSNGSNSPERADSYTILGLIYDRKEDLVKTRAYYDSANVIYKAAGLKKESAGILCNLAMVTSRDTTRLAEAITLFQKSLAIADSIGIPNLKLIIYNNMAGIYGEQGNFDRAIPMFQKAIQQALELKRMLAVKVLYKNLAKSFSQIGKYEEAFHQLVEHQNIKDSLNKLENKRLLYELTTKYETEKKDAELKLKDAELKKNKATIAQEKAENQTLIWGLILSAALVVLAAVAFLQKQRINRLLKEENIHLETENKEVKEEVDKLSDSLKDKDKILERLYSGNEGNLPENISALSKREMEVLAYIAIGFKDKEMAEKLFVSTNTIKTHVKRIYIKLDVNSRAELVALAHKYHLIGTDSTS